MGLQYRKSFKLLPGVRVNIGTRGFSSLSLRIKCIRLNLSKRGLQGHIAIPGTGLSYRFRGNKKRKRR